MLPLGREAAPKAQRHLTQRTHSTKPGAAAQPNGSKLPRHRLFGKHHNMCVYRFHHQRETFGPC
ncbi:hypothetical protein C0058_22060 [Pseudomonas sp. NC02]|nr:hypothetical protein C0058_22060 [Pseudomonas sp. NC02]